MVLEVGFGDSKIAVKSVLPDTDAHLWVAKNQVVLVVDDAVFLSQEVWLEEGEWENETELSAGAAFQGLVGVTADDSAASQFD
jgi:hypothetical protein